MRADPDMVAAEGGFVCVVCGEPLNDVTIKNQDPFCKAACANEWHGFEPLSRNYTLSGHPSGYAGSYGVRMWDDGARHRRRRAAARGEAA